MRCTVVLLCLVVGACGRGESRAADPESPAGSVETLTGDVTATRGGVTRALALKGEVWGDDTVTTGAGASVGIRLSHNGVLWTLEAGLTRRVDEGIAWRAPKQSGDDTLGRAEQDRTAAAGRHAEQEAGETGGTAAAPAVERATDEAARKAEEQAVEDELRKAEAEKRMAEEQLARREAEMQAARPKTAAAKKKSSRGGAPVDLGADPNDPLGGGLDRETGGGARAGDSGGLGAVGAKGGGAPGGGAPATARVQLSLDVRLEDGSDASTARRVVQATQGQLRYCVEKQLARDPSLRTGSVSLKLMVTDTGRTVAVNPQGAGDGFDAETLGCATQRLRGLAFPAQQPARIVLVTVRFKAE